MQCSERTLRKQFLLSKLQFFYVKFYSPYYAQERIVEMYVGDRSIDYYGIMENNKNDLVKSIKFNFIEKVNEYAKSKWQLQQCYLWKPLIYLFCFIESNFR